MTFISRSADDRPRLHATRRQRTLNDIVLTLVFFLSIGFSAAFVLGVIGH